VYNLTCTSQSPDDSDEESVTDSNRASIGDTNEPSQNKVDTSVPDLKLTVDDTSFVLVQPAEQFYDYYLIKCKGIVKTHNISVR